MKTELKDRVLWYDGISEISPEHLNYYLRKIPTDKLAVTEITDEVRQFNMLAFPKVQTKNSLEDLDIGYNIPEIDIELEIERILKGASGETINRVMKEYELFLKYELLDTLKLIIYIVRTFREKKVVWGVGRGSSCSLYILYLLGLHSVDCLKYGIHYSEFFKGEE
jgi:hypothetical protein